MDVVRTPHGGVDRGHRRQHVQRQERRAHPPAATCPDCPTARPDFQAGRGYPLRRRSHRVAQRAADSLGAGAPARRAASPRSRQTPRWSGSTRGSSSTPSCRRCAPSWRARGVRVIVAGLDQDYLGKPFEPMPQLLAVAEYITKTRAICMVCGNPANHTQRLVAEHRSRAARRDRDLRGALPPLLRPDPGQRRGRRGDDRRTIMTLPALLPQILLVARRGVPDRQRAGWRSSSCAGGAAGRQRCSSGRPAQAAVLRPEPRDRRGARHADPAQGLPHVASGGQLLSRCSCWRRRSAARRSIRSCRTAVLSGC